MMKRRLSTYLILAFALVLISGCGSRQKNTSQAVAGKTSSNTTKPTATNTKKVASKSDVEQADTKFLDLSKEIEKLGKGESVDQAWLEEKLNEILSIDPDFIAARFNLAVLKERNNDKESARRIYEQIVNENPNFAPAQENLAAFAVSEGKLDQALSIYRKIVASSPKNVTSRLALARLLITKKKYKNAIELCRKALQQKADAIEAFRILAKSYVELQNLPMAELIIGRGLKVNKDDVELHYLTAEILLGKGELAAGVNKLKEIITIDPKSIKVRAKLAQIALQYRDYGNAVQQFDAIIKEDPNNRPALIDLAVAYKGIGRFDQAEKIYKELLNKNANDATCLWNLAVLYQYHLNRYDEAIANYKKFKSIARADDQDANSVDKLIAEIEKQKNDLAAAKAREEREQKKIAATRAACQAINGGKKPDVKSIGNDKERIEVGWQLIVDAQTAIQNGDVAAGESIVKCAFAVIPDTPGAKIEACAPMHVMWTQILYQLGRPQDALISVREGLKCDPNNPDAQLAEQQLIEILGKQGNTVEEAAPTDDNDNKGKSKKGNRGSKKRKVK
ncbi:MAG: tetratricopeptide repeat protein [Deltaproteobacteria bacterium]|nr:tetratricopeptide repeat protein [Deltaproteobacteria bacterium]